MGKIRSVSPKRKVKDRNEDFKFIMPLYLKGMGFGEIAKELNAIREYKVTYQVIYEDVQTVIDRWQLERVAMIDKQKEVDLKKIDKLEATYWQAWEDSKTAKVKTVQKERSIFDKKKKKQVGDIANRQSERHVVEGIGNKEWLEGVQWCIQERGKILQYNKSAAPGPEETPEPTVIAVRDIVFVTRTRKNNNDHITEAEEVNDDQDNITQTLIQL